MLRRGCWWEGGGGSRVGPKETHTRREQSGEERGEVVRRVKG